MIERDGHKIKENEYDSYYLGKKYKEQKLYKVSTWESPTQQGVEFICVGFKLPIEEMDEED